MMYDYLWEYFVSYQMTENKKKKKKIINDFLEYIYTGDAFNTKESNDILFGNLYENKFGITKEQKHLFIKWCVRKMFNNYLDEEEYEKKSIAKGLKRVKEISYKSLYDQDIIENRLERYFCRTIFFELCNNSYKFHNPVYFQCQECGGWFIKITNIKNNRQKYCIDCRSIVKNRQNCEYKKKVGRTKI